MNEDSSDPYSFQSISLRTAGNVRIVTCLGEGQVPCVHPFPPPLTVCLISLTKVEVKVVGLDPSFVNCT